MGDYMVEEKLIVDASLEQLDTVMMKLENVLEQAECPMKFVTKISLCVEELYVNVVNYAYDENEERKDCEISVVADTVQKDGKTGTKATVTIKDHGKEFNPLMKEDPDITLSADDRPIGGLGIFMVKEMMDDVFYEYIDGYNTIVLEITWF